MAASTTLLCYWVCVPLAGAAAAVAASMLCRPAASWSRRPQAKSKMSKAEKAKAKKDKAKAFNQAPSAAGKPAKNAKRWN